jgi:hypothetical protein
MTDIKDWGQRLSDRIRAALAAGDVAAARRLVVEGDGQARSLEKEYSLMYRGLGITLRVLLDLMPRVLPRMHDTKAAETALRTLLSSFRTDMQALITHLDGGAAGTDRTAAVESSSDVDLDLVATRGLIDAAEARFLDTQTRLAREVLGALDRGDLTTAGRLADTKEREQYVPLHDRIVRFMAEVFGWVLRHGGPAELLRVHLATAEGQRDGFQRWERLPADEFARATAFLLKQHMGDVTVTEDAEKFTIEQRPCGSGGRLHAGGAYAGADALPFVESRGPLTLGEARMPVYCSHCPVWNGLAPIAWFGRPHWVFDRPARPDGSCTLHVYKRRDGAPADYARRLGCGARP